MRRVSPLRVALLLTTLLVVGGATALVTRGSAGAAAPPVPEEGAGSGVVQLSADAAVHPAAGPVRAQLQRHYDAINGQDYAEWSATVVPARVETLPEAAWRDAYATTRDGSIRMDRIDAGSDGSLLVRVRFVSTQAVQDAPPGLQAPRICWYSTLPMRGTPPLIDVTGGGSSARAAC